MPISKYMILFNGLFALYCIALVTSKTISFTILYEKVLQDFPQKLTKALIDKALDDYNRHLEALGIKFSLNSIMDYSQYSQIHEFKPLSGLVGEGNLKKRLKALEKIGANLIIIYSSVDRADTSKFNSLSSCKGRYFINLSDKKTPSDEVIPVSLGSIKDWMGDLLKVDMPEFYELENTSPHPNPDGRAHFYIESSVVEDLMLCSLASEPDHVPGRSSRHSRGLPDRQPMDLRRKIEYLETQIEALKLNSYSEGLSNGERLGMRNGPKVSKSIRMDDAKSGDIDENLITKGLYRRRGSIKADDEIETKQRHPGKFAFPK